MLCHTYINTLNTLNSLHYITFIHRYMHTCIHSIHAYMHTCIHAYMHTYIHACIHTYIHTECGRANAINFIPRSSPFSWEFNHIQNGSCHNGSQGCPQKNMSFFSSIFFQPGSFAEELGPFLISMTLQGLLYPSAIFSAWGNWSKTTPFLDTKGAQEKRKRSSHRSVGGG